MKITFLQISLLVKLVCWTNDKQNPNITVSFLKMAHNKWTRSRPSFVNLKSDQFHPCYWCVVYYIRWPLYIYLFFHYTIFIPGSCLTPTIPLRIYRCMCTGKYAAVWDGVHLIKRVVVTRTEITEKMAYVLINQSHVSHDASDKYPTMHSVVCVHRLLYKQLLVIWDILIVMWPPSHNAPFCNRNVHMCTFLLQNGALWDICLMHCGIWDWAHCRIVNLVYL